MKNIRILFILALIIVFSGLSGCSSAEKASRERQNLMMIEKSDLKRNSPYNAPKKKKTYKPKKHKKKKSKKWK
jgi:uncharacterized protein YcfL